MPPKLTFPASYPRDEEPLYGYVELGYLLSVFGHPIKERDGR